MMKYLRPNEQGQSMFIIGAAIVALLAMLALVIDAGNNYVQKRILQNATVSGSVAGGLAMAQGKKNGEIALAAKNAALTNIAAPDRDKVAPTLKVYFVVRDSNGKDIVVRGADGKQYVDTYYGALNSPPTTISPTPGAPALPVVGVQVEGDKPFGTFMAGLISRTDLQVTAGAAAYAQKGVCQGDSLFPLTLPIETFPDSNGDGVREVNYSTEYQLFGTKTGPGSFGYLSWYGDPSEQELVRNITYPNPQPSGLWRVGDWVPTGPGVKASSNVQAQLDLWKNKEVVIPVFNATQGTGNNLKYQIAGFARFKLISYNYQGSDKYITGQFIRWQASGPGGCADFGSTSPVSNPGTDASKRTIVGTVRFNQLSLVSYPASAGRVPVDVVHVLDVSGSMDDPVYGTTGNKKINVAKNALISFNQNLVVTTTGGTTDQVGLAVFPNNNSSPPPSSSSYNVVCNRVIKTSKWKLGATTKSNLTTNVASVNSIINGLNWGSYTPLAAGIQQGAAVLKGTSHKASNARVMIVASDGIANFLLNGNYAGLSGSGDQDTPADQNCLNATAGQDAIDQANTLKADNDGDGYPDALIFSIAIGSDFNSAVLQAVASTQTKANEPYFFTATDPASMQSIYNQISKRVQALAGSCQVIQTPRLAPSATVKLKNQDTGQEFTVQTDATGQFVIPNAAAGTYVFLSASVTYGPYVYNVFTNGVGGPTSGSNPTLVVGSGTGTYPTDVALKTNANVTCP
jgi:hypothetical protein